MIFVSTKNSLDKLRSATAIACAPETGERATGTARTDGPAETDGPARTSPAQTDGPAQTSPAGEHVVRRVVAVTCPAPTGLEYAILDAAIDDDIAYFWAPGLETPLDPSLDAGTQGVDGPDEAKCQWSVDHAEGREGPGDTCVAVGTSLLLKEEGADRFESMRARIARALDGISGATEATEGVRFFGGAAFHPGGDLSSLWQEFGDTSFFLPQVLYRSNGRTARLVCTFLSDVPGSFDAMLAQATRLLCTDGDLKSASQLDQNENGATTIVSTVDETPADSWCGLVEAIKADIQRGVLRKVVTARRLSLELSDSPSAATALRRLAETAPACTRFALVRHGQVFLGATPERLVRLEGQFVTTEALAGTVALGAEADTAITAFRADPKERQEHAVVVEAIRETLAPICSEIILRDSPTVRRLAHLAHLSTPVSARLTSRSHILRLLAALHPTPAVGGMPREAALEWIAHHEATERGWYAAPIGWVDVHGNGDFVVALRSALLRGKTAHLFAGAGIVADSDATCEYAETNLKLESMRTALLGG